MYADRLRPDRFAALTNAARSAADTFKPMNTFRASGKVGRPSFGFLVIIPLV